MKIKCIFLLIILVLCSSFSRDVKADQVGFFDTVDISGDLRYRLESIDQEYEVYRHRHRIRARLNFIGGVSDNLDIIIGLESGYPNDPVSSNQTLGSGFSSKPVWLDLAYFDYHPFGGGNFYAGKMENPFQAVGGSELVWDSDFNPEGLAFSLEPELKNVTPFLRGVLFWAEERKDDYDSFIVGSEFGLNLHNDHFYVLGGGRYIHFENMKNHQVLWDSRDSFGNSANKDLDGEFYYINEYKLIGEFVEIGGDVSGVKWSLFGDYVNNNYLINDNNAWLVGTSLGKCKKATNICFRYIYRKIGKDAVVGIFSDSDFADGKTDSKGHEFNLGTNVSDHIKTQISYFNNEFNNEFGNLSINYQRVQIDLSANF